MALRMFLAVELEEEIQKQLLRVRPRLEEAATKTRWTGKDNWHITLHFLGDVPDGDVMDVCRIVSDVAGQMNDFEISVRGLQVTPPSGPPRVLWANIVDESGSLRAMHALLGNRLEEAGFRLEDRRYNPHVTLARIKAIADGRPLRAAVEQYAETEFGQQRVDRLIAFSSQLTPDGPIYTPVSSVMLG